MASLGGSGLKLQTQRYILDDFRLKFEYNNKIQPFYP